MSNNARKGWEPVIKAALITGACAIVAAVVTGIFAYVSSLARSAHPQTSSSDSASRPLVAARTPTPTGASTSGSPAGGMTASIRQPTTATSVPLCLSASGDAHHVPAGTTLWLFIQVPDQNDHPARWYALAKLKIDSAGKWTAPRLQIGDPGGG